MRSLGYLHGKEGTVRWMAVLVVLCVLLQRFATPGVPQVALLLPVVLLWCGVGLVTGVLEPDDLRTRWWLAAAGLTALVVPAQQALVAKASLSPASWGLFLLTWAPVTLRFTDRRRETFVAAMRPVVATMIGLAIVVIIMMASQFAGLPYRDWLASFVPSQFLLQDFVITYPLHYGSPIYRGNGWIGLEPSIVSAQIGVGLLVALLIEARVVTVLVLVAALVCTVAGSGFAIVAVGVLALLTQPARQTLRRYAVVGPLTIAFMLSTPWGWSMVSRLTETSSSRSSTSLRAITPYHYLFPAWTSDLATLLLGRGPGSAQRLVDDTNILGLLVPTPMKIFFEYGLVAGLALGSLLALVYLGGHATSIGSALFVSLWLIQPGTTVMVFVVLVPMLITWWNPAPSPHLPAWSSPPRPAVLDGALAMSRGRQ